jgi:hypothetical protein
LPERLRALLNRVGGLAPVLFLWALLSYRRKPQPPPPEPALSDNNGTACLLTNPLEPDHDSATKPISVPL